MAAEAMARETLLDFFEDLARLHDVFVVYDDGYRTRESTYAEVAAAARRFAGRLRDAGVEPDDKVVIWSENRPEWIAALWGTLLAGAVLVPVDYRTSSELVARIGRRVDARLLLAGEEGDVPRDIPAHVWRLRDFGDDGNLRGVDAATTETGGGDEATRPTGSTLAEIIFTSGATGEPKGVTLTHRNILANLIPIEREIAKYRRYERPFHPIRFLNLLPLSHMFGQAMATFVPPMIGGTVVFSHSYSPADVLEQIRTRRVSVLVAVPKVLAMLRDHVERLVPDAADPDPLAGHHWLRRWWHYRRVHRLFGWKFWCIVCGAAPLDPALEAFWRKLGFLVVQGYGLTETAPIVTLNHPFRASQGSVGTPIAGVEVRIADDGEVLVRGDNVTTGYYQDEGSDPESPLEDGWFHTGDIGQIDERGRLAIKGRKKEMIVTAQGLNVFPEDVERALLARPGVADAAVVGVPAGGEERVHAVLVVAPDADVDAIIREANRTLEDHQRVRGVSVWPHGALPRTEGTEKLRRHELRRWVAGEQPPDRAEAGAGGVRQVVQQFAGAQAVDADTTLAELGLSSLDRVELMMALENAFQVTLDE